MDAEPSPANETAVGNPLDTIRRLRSAGGAMLAQVLLHTELARIEWEEEKRRLLKMLGVTLLGFACLQCGLLFAGALVLAAAWDTSYRLPALALLVISCSIAVAIAWRRFRALSAQEGQAFANSREQLARDVALLKATL